MKSKVKHSEIQSKSTNKINQKKYMLLVEIWQTIYYGELRKEPVKKLDLIFKYGKHRDTVEKIWECVYDLKIEWPYEMYDRVFED